MRQYDRVWATVDLDAIVANLLSMRDGLKAAGKWGEHSGIYGVVKADGYGHGSVPVAKAIEPYVMGIAVATVDEALILKRHGISRPVVLLSTPNPRRFAEVVDYDLQPAVYIWEHALALSELARIAGKTVPIHFAVDTGMSRIGVPPTSQSAELAVRMAALPGIRIEGVFTHFARADEADKASSNEQARLFMSFLGMLEARGLAVPVRHISNSAAIMELPLITLDAVRAGISMYGLYPSGDPGKSRQHLKPALQLKSEITFVKEVPAGTPVSYGGIFTSSGAVKVATIPVGYGDGYPRNLSGKGYVLIKGARAPVLGRVCMDQMMVDVTGIDACPGDEVTLIGRDGDDEIRVEELAGLGGRFHYEIICLLGKRVPRIYMKDGKAVACKDYFSDQFSADLC